MPPKDGKDSVTFDRLPTIPNHTWRSLAPDDAPALVRLEQACSRLDGASHLAGEAEWRERLSNAVESAAAVTGHGEIAVAGVIEVTPGADSERAFLDGRVHPGFRGQGVGSALLSWMEVRASRHLRAIDTARPKVLRIMFWDRVDDAIALFEQHGFEFMFKEDELRVDLRDDRPRLPLSPGLTVERWSSQNALEFYTVYRDAFGTRTNAPLSEEDWTRFWANPDDPEFHPELSFLVRDGTEPAAFNVGHVYEVDEAFVAQFGVRQAWRRQGVGAAVLAEALNQFAAAGYRTGVLAVNIDNPNARRLYERAGFKLAKQMTMYRKSVETAR